MEQRQQTLVLTHSVLVGLSPLIPIPFLDDFVMSYFQRRCVRKLAEDYRIFLSDADVAILADGEDGSFWKGIAKKVALLPIKLLSRTVRKLLMVLEYKRMADVASLSFHQGYLLEYILQTHWSAPEAVIDAKAARAAIDAACAKVGVKVVGMTFRTIFGQSKAALASGIDILTGSLRTIVGRPERKDVEAAVEQVEAAEEKVVQGVVERLRTAMGQVPADHFRKLCDAVDAELKPPPLKSSSALPAGNPL
jgi:hypothetical protein